MSQSKLTEQVGSLSPDKRALLELKLKLAGGSPALRESIPRRANGEPGPLSFAQERLWFLNQLEPESPAYNESRAMRIAGLLDAHALQRALNEIVARHQILRTAIVTANGSPRQQILKNRDLELPIVDLQTLPETDRDSEARRLMAEIIRKPFDLSRDLMLRPVLFRLGAQEYIFLLVKHHIASDAWSSGILWKELAVLYGAFRAGQSSPLADLPLQYADFAVWQRNWLRGEILEAQLSYWKEQLQGISPLRLPTDRPRSEVKHSQGATESLTLPENLCEALKRLNRQQGVTLFMTLLAAFKALLHRYTGQKDIVVGSPIANRNRTEIEGLIGFFVNTLVLRSNFSADSTFNEVLSQVKQNALGAFAHQDLPFEKLVEEIQPQRSFNDTPLFQVLFNMVSHEDANLELPGLTLERIATSSLDSKFDMTLYVRRQSNQISLNLVYKVELFDRPRMICFLQQYRYLLEQIAAAPDAPIRSYSLLTPESRALLPDPGAVLTEPAQQLVTGTFLSWAKNAPAHPAVSQGQQTWTYNELARRADTLARLITARGIAPGDVIAVYGPPSFGLIAAMIAVLLSGGVLLPLDCSLPAQRKQRMLREARARQLLYVGANESDDAWLKEEFDAAILFIDPQEGAAIDTEPAMTPDTITLPEVGIDDPAYLFFTSGTTGVPKGVLGCHKGLSHFLGWQRETFAIGPRDRVAQLTGLSFDAVLRDIFLPLTSGATLCLRDLDDAFASSEILRWLARQQITVLHVVPSLAQSWLASGTKTYLASMRRVFFLGEPLTEALVHQWRAVCPNTAEIVNLYGPTETTLVKCFYRVPAATLPGVQPLGRPIPNTQALVLNDHNQLCGINEPGEIVLRTPFRTLGYVNCPEESHKRFVKNFFRDDAADLIYFTGDAGFYQPDGTLRILGRLDDEIKIRGVRIEPAEVTSALARHPLVQSCIVLGKKNHRHESYLAAYIVPSGQEELTSDGLRSYLLEQLPPAMVPSVFVLLESLPLTPNGKVDRKALPEPDQQSSVPEERYIAPRSEIEKLLAAIWAEVLKLPRVGVCDNFFELGGHSLLATQIVSRIREALQLDVALRALFEKPTIAGLSDQLETIQRTGKQNGLTSAGTADESEEVML